MISPVSNTVNVKIADSGGSVAISTRYGDELVISATGTADTLSISESGSTLTIVADGQTYTDPAPAAGLFVYARGGSDGITIDQTVTARTTIESADGAATAINSSGTNVSAWIDANDTFTGSASVHRIANFAAGVTKATGAALANPKDAGTTTKANLSLFGTGPVAGDINQGSVGDCYFLSSLAAFAGTKASVVQEAAVDMGDGTYAVQFFQQNQPVYVRVSNDMPGGYFGGYAYAHPGANNSIWAMVMEKAFCYLRSGANTYASIGSGWMGEVYSDLGVNAFNFSPNSYSESAFYDMLNADLASGKAVTLGTSNAPNLVHGHAYTLVSVSKDANGVTHYVVRNPWGVAGTSTEDSHGYATLTFAQIKSNFIAGSQAA
jgi:hypothetical protein